MSFGTISLSRIPLPTISMDLMEWLWFTARSLTRILFGSYFYSLTTDNYHRQLEALTRLIQLSGERPASSSRLTSLLISGCTVFAVTAHGVVICRFEETGRNITIQFDLPLYINIKFFSYWQLYKSPRGATTLP